ncbi:wax ester synthase/diacylglycerol acyltransferase 4-like [Salvia miltiorrhiza]|uniref:wax ester synthase/diacylglycerol acyltransferase 4-like n=1 Tax=Salvia miltiorrhiza TaxID=226208 RepID=UPI0025ACF744|nr:wax ester synthase/diacylglycerol acyltransferase 4-like [Salvia miltiorrhiza]
MEGEEEVFEPMSPTAQYLKSSALSLTILGVMEMEDDIDDSITMSFIKDIFLSINPRFSSIMVADKDGVRKWKKVEVNLEDHVYKPTFPSGMSVDYYNECFNDYLSKLATEQLPQDRSLWEIHILKYPTKNAAGNIISKLHHSLGDGYSLMGSLLTCLQRIDDPSLPLSFPPLQSSTGPRIRRNSFLRRVPRIFTGIVNTAYDFGWGLLKSTSMKDDKSPIRSGVDGVEFRRIATTTTSFSIDQLKQIKSKLNVTINDVVTGMIILGTRLYMQKTDEQSCKSNTTALVLLNTRAIRGYKSVDEMIKPNSDTPWGNQFTFLHVPLPKLTQSKLLDPLYFVKKAHRMIKKQKNSAAIYLIGQFLSFITRVKGHEATARHIHATLKNTSMAISNMIGPIEPVALVNQPCKGLYFAVAGPPQSLSITMVSYVGKLRIAVTSEKEFIDPNKMKSCIEYAFEVIYKAALEV